MNTEHKCRVCGVDIPPPSYRQYCAECKIAVKKKLAKELAVKNRERYREKYQQQKHIRSRKDKQRYAAKRAAYIETHGAKKCKVCETEIPFSKMYCESCAFEKQNERNRKYYAEYYRKNIERIKVYQVEYRERNKEKRKAEYQASKWFHKLKYRQQKAERMAAEQ